MAVPNYVDSIGEKVKEEKSPSSMSEHSWIAAAEESVLSEETNSLPQDATAAHMPSCSCRVPVATRITFSLGVLILRYVTPPYQFAASNVEVLGDILNLNRRMATLEN
ncbi:hypothetical protein PIB30_024917 [Stylosanthes scabra]|uniref:Uncharacterized protein n=1 Tax=Stylosanthes scabra TaxID=79078 RepID=A0ABU6TBS2_9FABA|nr:hypothetical protein [Stylosanthes scabra]